MVPDPEHWFEPMKGHLGGEEQRGGGDGVPVEASEGVEHVEPLHVHYRRVDTQLRPKHKKESLLLDNNNQRMKNRHQ